MKLKAFARTVLLGVARFAGVRLRDPRTGEVVGRALFVPWRGRLLVIGLDRGVIPEFQPQSRQTYWVQELAFRDCEEPDFPNERGS